MKNLGEKEICSSGQAASRICNERNSGGGDTLETNGEEENKILESFHAVAKADDFKQYRVGVKRGWNPLSPRGYGFFELLSALQKDIRRGNEEQAVFWASELESMGPKQIETLWRRLKIIAVEDVGLANQIAPIVLYYLEMQYFDLKKTNNKKKPERLPLVNAVLFLAGSLKSRLVDNLLNVVYGEKELEKNNPKIPTEYIDMHTRDGAKGQVGIERFFDKGTKLDREAIVDPYKDRARAVLIEKEKAREVKE